MAHKLKLEQRVKELERLVAILSANFDKRLGSAIDRVMMDFEISGGEERAVEIKLMREMERELRS